jgi:hypothetical protein
MLQNGLSTAHLRDLTDAVGHFADLFEPDALARGMWRNASGGP